MLKKVSIKKETLTSLVEFYNQKFEYKIDIKEAYMLCKLGKRLMADLWNLLIVEQNVNVNEYYKLCPYGPFELAFANANKGNSKFRKLVVKHSLGDVLDYGGGDGSLSLEMAKKKNSVIYVDIDSINMEYAKWSFKKAGANNILIFNAMKDEEKIWNRQYDTVICIEVIEHVSDPKSLIKKLCSVVKPGGKLIITRLECPGPTPDLPLHFKLPFSGAKLLNESGFKEIEDVFEGDRSLWIKI